MGLRCVLCGRSHLPTEVCGRDTEAGLGRGALARVEVGASVVKEAVREALVTGSAFVQDGRVLRAEEVLAPATKSDRAAYHKAYMREYMRGWRARKKGGG
jgi:hypothetical protein